MSTLGTTALRTLPLLALAAGAAAARPAAQAVDDWGRTSHVIVPQASGFALDRQGPAIRIEQVEARVEVVEQAARTTLEVTVFNPSGLRAAAVLLLPVPGHAAVSEFTFEGAAAEPSARLLPRDEARRAYDEIVARIKDPALLEFAGLNLIRSSVFPVPAGGRQRVRLTYEHVLTADGDRVDYQLLRSESLAVRVPWRITVDIRADSPISMVYSPSHDLVTRVREGRRVVVEVHPSSADRPGSFLLSRLLQRDGVTASLLAYPGPEAGGGFFLLLAGLPAPVEDGERRIPREVTLVIDRSGSMAGEKMDQALAAARQVIEGLEDGETFNVIDYASQVELFAPAPVIKTRETTLAVREYLAAIRPTGGTNIHDALLEALSCEHRPGMLPLVLFLTDGLPTVGRTAEVDIRALVENGNPHHRRIFTFGVGSDVNVPLLDRLSDATRATSTYVMPGEDVEVKVGAVFRRLSGPILADLELWTVGPDGAPTTRAVRELMPARLPDLFDGDQLLLFGQYRAAPAVAFRLTASTRGGLRTFAFEFDLSKASTRHSFVPRLWATRKIAFLVDQIRQAGAAVAGGFGPEIDVFTDPRCRELAEEILRLSTRYGVLSEYTAFLATEGSDLGDWEALRLGCTANLQRRAVGVRSGIGAVNQGLNFNEKKAEAQLDLTNGFWDANNQRVSISTVQQVCDRAFFRRGDRWVDARLIATPGGLEAEEVVEFGSEAHRRLLERLVGEGRQGLLALPGNILMPVEGKTVLIQNGGN
ncbi:MAG: VIT and VWA domain-containing protein [Planctomycetota bacterium]